MSQTNNKGQDKETEGPKVKILESTPNPEELVCTAARNDYRNDGVIGYDFKEIMRDIEPDNDLTSLLDVEELTKSEKDNLVIPKKKTLLSHLMDNGHWGPFEHPQATVAIENVTRVVTHQIVRHRHFTYDQQSFRYVEVEDIDEDERSELEEQFHVPEFRGEDIDVDRHGVHEIDSPKEAKKEYIGSYSWSVNYYKRLRDRGVPKEKARKVLPMGIKTNIVMSGNARAWMHILNVRTKANVQNETREVAEAIFEELKEWMPYTFQKYDEDILPLRLNP